MAIVGFFITLITTLVFLIFLMKIFESNMHDQKINVVTDNINLDIETVKKDLPNYLRFEVKQSENSAFLSSVDIIRSCTSCLSLQNTYISLNIERESFLNLELRNVISIFNQSKINFSSINYDFIHSKNSVFPCKAFIKRSKRDLLIFKKYGALYDVPFEYFKAISAIFFCNSDSWEFTINMFRFVQCIYQDISKNLKNLKNEQSNKYLHIRQNQIISYYNLIAPLFEKSLTKSEKIIAAPISIFFLTKTLKNLNFFSTRDLTVFPLAGLLHEDLDLMRYSCVLKAHQYRIVFVLLKNTVELDSGIHSCIEATLNFAYDQMRNYVHNSQTEKDYQSTIIPVESKFQMVCSYNRIRKHLTKPINALKDFFKSEKKDHMVVETTHFFYILSIKNVFTDKIYLMNRSRIIKNSTLDFSETTL